MSREADFSQLEKFIGDFQSAFGDFEHWLEGFLLEEGNRAIKEMTERHNQIYAATGKTVDTGAMRELWFVGEVIINGNEISVIVGNSADYASFIEYGARNVDGSWREGYFIMTIPADRIQKQMPLRFEREFAEYMKSKGAN